MLEFILYSQLCLVISLVLYCSIFCGPSWIIGVNDAKFHVHIPSFSYEETQIFMSIFPVPPLPPPLPPVIWLQLDRVCRGEPGDEGKRMGGGRENVKREERERKKEERGNGDGDE